MNSTHKLLGTALFGLLPIFATAYAQSDATTTVSGSTSTTAPLTPPDTKSEEGWVLGRTYIQADASIEKFTTTTHTATGAIPGLGLNLPLGDNFDYGFNYAYEHAANSSFKLNDNTAETGFTFYNKFIGLAPFVTADIGYDWQRSAGTTAPTRFDHALYDVAAGVEIPVSKEAALRAWIDHNSSFASPHENNWTYNVGANSWINNTLGTFVGVGWKSGYLGSHDSIGYTAGLRFSLDSE
jgi:hypothetical protein